MDWITQWMPAATADRIAMFGAWLQTLIILGGIIGFFGNQRKAIANQKLEIYQRLEIESNSVFRMEAENRSAIVDFKTHLAPPATAEFAHVNDDATQLIARKYYENSCNMFEVAARLRKQDIVDHTVFGSWVAWYFDTLTEWGFRAMWDDLRDNYTPELRAIFDKPVEELIQQWDIPWAEGKLAVSHDGLAIATLPLRATRQRFYSHVGGMYGCTEILGWLDAVEKGRPQYRHPRAFS